MTPPASASPAEKARSQVESLESAATRAKLNFINAAHAASPLRLVEQHPIASVTATAAAAMTLTVLASSRLFSPATTGFLSRGLAMAGTFARSDLVAQFAQSILAKATGGTPGEAAADSASMPVADPDANAVG